MSLRGNATRCERRNRTGAIAEAIHTTYLGGTADDRALGIAVGADGSGYVGGRNGFGGS
jgi:hypothetical protein